MFDYTLHLSENQIIWLFWVEAGCPREEDNPLAEKIRTMRSFLASANKFIIAGFVHHAINDEGRSHDDPAYKLTDKGEILCWLLHKELENWHWQPEYLKEAQHAD